MEKKRDRKKKCVAGKYKKKSHLKSQSADEHGGECCYWAAGLGNECHPAGPAKICSVPPGTS